MPFFDRVQKSPRAKTPNWRQVGILLLGGFLLVVSGCGGAYLVFSASYGASSSKVFVVLWWVLMGVFCIGLLMLIAGVLFILFIAIRAAGRAVRGGSAGDGQ